jgi:hypothetical protein
MTTIVGFGRARLSALHRYIRFAHQTHNPVRRIRVGDRQGVFIRGDITYFLYVPIGRFAYYVSNHSALENTLTVRQMVQMLATATSLGTEWVGQTSQGHVVDLYRTTAGLDYYVEWYTDCELSGELVFTVADPLVSVAADTFDDSGPYTMSTGESAQVNFDGLLTTPTAMGTLQGQYELDGDLCQSGPLVWSADEVGA